MAPRPAVVIAHGYAHHIWGSEKVALEAALAYRQGGWRVVFYLPGAGPFTDLVRENGFALKAVPTVPDHGPGRWPLALSARLSLQLGRDRPDLVHVTSLGPLRVVSPAARLLRMPVAVQLQTPYTGQALVRGRIRAADLVMPVSREVLEPAREVLAQGKHDGFPEVHLLRPPVGGPDAGAARRGRLLRESWSLAPGEKAVGMVGQIIPRKGVDLFLDACASLNRKGLKTRPVLVGAPAQGAEPYSREMRARAEALGLGEALITTGKVEDVAAHYQALDVLAVPSRREGLGLVAGEAMRCGLPVVAAAAGGLTELVIDGRTGLLCPVDDAPALAAALGRVLTDPELSAHLAAGGRRHADRNFSHRRFQARLLMLAQLTAGATGLAPGAGPDLTLSTTRECSAYE